MRTIYTCEDCVSFDSEYNFCNFICTDTFPDCFACPFFFNGSYSDSQINSND